MAITKLSTLATKINQFAAECEEALATARNAEYSALSSAKEAGKLLIKAKAQVKYGQWVSWLEENCTISPRYAQQFMQIAEHFNELEAAGVQSISGAIRALKKTKQIKAAPASVMLPESPESEAIEVEQVESESEQSEFVETVQIDEAPAPERAAFLAEFLESEPVAAVPKIATAMPHSVIEVPQTPQIEIIINRAEQAIRILELCNQQEIEDVLQWLEDRGYLQSEQPETEAADKNERHFVSEEAELSPRTKLEQALKFMARRCDGAETRDDTGFNGADTGFGHWLADRIAEGRPIKQSWAESALKMLQKYRKTQLEPNGFDLPTLAEVEESYSEELAAAAKVELKSDFRIELKGDLVIARSPYGEINTSIYKSVAGYHFDGSEKTWEFPAKNAALLIEALGDNLAKFEVDPRIQAAIDEAEAERYQKAIEAAESILELIEAAKLDEPLPNGRTLFEHQKEAVSFLLSHRKNGILEGGILADDMGLGKTCSALVAAKAMLAVYDCPIFVVCPASLKDNWLREAEGVGVAIEVFSWAKLPKPLETQKYLLIADEAHYAQDSRSQRSKAMKELAQSVNCLAFWGLTGTPLKNGRPINLYPLLDACKHPLAADKLQYQKYYCNAHQKSVGRGRTVWDVSGAAHLNELAKKTEDVILRRKKSDCLDLPPKIRQMKPVELASSEEKEYQARINELVQDYRERAERGEVDSDAEALVTLNILRKTGSEFKAAPAIELAQELLEQGQQVVIFTEFLESAKAIHEALGGELLTGETPTEERQKIVDRFQSGESKVFVGTIKAGGVGITLTAASYVLLVDRPWTSGDVEQCEDRCNRIGQTQTVNALWLQYGAIDTAIDQLLEQKAERIELVLKGKRKTLRGVGSVNDLAKELLAVL